MVGASRYYMDIVDSYNILAHKLDDLCEAYSTTTTKGIFPYDFMTNNTLFYIGRKPKINYWNLDKRDSDYAKRLEVYNLIPNKNWDAQESTIKYLNDDLISLFEVMTKFNEEIYLKYDTQVTNNLTISGIAMDIYLRRYHQDCIPLINRKSIFNEIRESYYGGVSEVYRPTNSDNEVLYYYDVNSLYPHASLNSMPGLDCTYVDTIGKYIDELTDLNNFFGFFYSIKFNILFNRNNFIVFQ